MTMVNDGDAELPDGWRLSPLKQIADINPRHPRDLDDSQLVTFLPMAGISESNPSFESSEERPLGNVRKGFTHFAEGDVLFAKITPCMENGKAAVARGLTNGIGCGTTELHVVRPLDVVMPEYVYHFLHQERIRRDAAALFNGSAGQLRVPVDFINELLIPLPPIAEQKRIVAKVELLISRVQSVRNRLSRIGPLLKRFRQSLLAAACDGKLTTDWRALQNEERPWIDVELRDICEIIGGSQPPKSHFVFEPRNGYIRFIQIRDYKSEKHLTFIPRNLARRTCSVNDVMIGRYGPPLFQILRGIEGAYNVALMKAVPRDSGVLANDFLYYLLQYPPLRADVIQFSERTVGQDGIRKELLEEYPLKLPPLNEQHEIVRRIEALLKVADAIERRIAATAARADKLTQSILARAFRGELVPTEAEFARTEKGDCESATSLLARVKASRQVENGAQNRKRHRTAGTSL